MTWPGESTPVEAVIFDWGGTLTPWHDVDHAEESRALAAAVVGEGPGDAPQVLLEAATAVWTRSRDEHVSATLREEFFMRDGVLELLDGAVYTSEVPWTKPAPQAFEAAMDAVGVTDPAACVFVGDRLFDDIWGATNVGMRTVLVPHSDIPAWQVGHSLGEPDAVVERLAHVYDVVASWRAA